MEETIVLYSTPEHLNSLTCLALFIAKHHPSISVAVLSTDAPPIPAASSVTFLRLPSPDLPAKFTPVELFFETPRLNNPNFRQALAQISLKSNIRAVVLDFFCNYAFEICESLSIPVYFCNTTGASALCALMYWPQFHDKTGGKLGDSVEIPGCPVIPAADLPEMLHFPQSRSYKHLMDTAKNIEKSAGVIVNTFAALEVRALEALRNNLCTTNPPIYAIGPLIDVRIRNDAVDECLRWLDSQPSKSVIFLCFGRRGAFSGEQLREIAIGLENSGYRFVWAVRSSGSGSEELESVLPEGFVERTGERGRVLKSWAPQTAVLSHGSVGGFVTHCGQSSVLEAVSFGVPMIGWPLYAEQRMNRVVMVEEMKVAVAVELGQEGFVAAGEVEERVRELMESRRGEEIGRRVEELRAAAAAAGREGGSAVVALDEFITAVQGARELHENKGSV
ncbi:chalcone 4'-O-glucosyltransferase-like [Salvia hispanica]|uniref:chalcone 4'-O-glucosyltransferase-like n=1 Tax=Salvia hispanica TaxID=49212 RepID=UPI0020095EE1|nr:chalcone 4'-O-glucosyltransferase-like [Salvia hispanica]